MLGPQLGLYHNNNDDIMYDIFSGRVGVIGEPKLEFQGNFYGNSHFFSSWCRVTGVTQMTVDHLAP